MLTRQPDLGAFAAPPVRTCSVSTFAVVGLREPVTFDCSSLCSLSVGDCSCSEFDRPAKYSMDAPHPSCPSACWDQAPPERPREIAIRVLRRLSLASSAASAAEGRSCYCDNCRSWMDLDPYLAHLRYCCRRLLHYCVDYGAP